HTRFSRDWSSDVCSSDLEILRMPEQPNSRIGLSHPLHDRRAVVWRAIVDAYNLYVRQRLGLDGGEALLQVELGLEERDDHGDMRSEERRVGKECRSRAAA